MEPGSCASPPGLTSVARPVEFDLGGRKRLLDEQAGFLRARIAECWRTRGLRSSAGGNAADAHGTVAAGSPDGDVIATDATLKR